MKETVIPITPVRQPSVPASQRTAALTKLGSPAPIEHEIQFVEVTASPLVREPMIISLYGGAGSGKSRFIGSAQGPIGAVALEHKSRYSITKEAQARGKRVIMPDVDLVRSARALTTENLPHACVTADEFRAQRFRDEEADKMAEMAMAKKHKEMRIDGPLPTCCQRCYYRWHANRSKYVLYRLADMPEIKTIAIDPFGQFVDDMLFACYGRNEKIMPLDRKSFNREVVDVINNVSHKNLILTHHSDLIWKDNKPTGKTKPKSSFAKIGHFTSVVMELVRDDDANLEKGEPRYICRVKDCQANAELIGADLLSDGEISFANVAAAVYGTGEEEWE